jgi:hypothetical protein
MALVALGACHAPSTPTLTTGLTGTVLRGPITPVCQINLACEAPFSAGFTAQRDGNIVTHFQSDAAGQFMVCLQPGTYRIVPDTDAPIISPTSQTKMATVGQVGLTTVSFVFDTGIR